jgi:hypothetical protein
MVEDGRGDRSKRGGDGAKVREDTGGGLLGHVVKELEREVLGKGGKGAEGGKGKAEFGEKVENTHHPLSSTVPSRSSSKPTT